MELRGRGECKSRNERKRFKIVTNGILTEFGYFTYVGKIANDIIDIKPCHGKSLDEILGIAIKIKNNSDYDEVDIVIDVDQARKDKKEQSNLIDFLAKAEEAGILVYLSNECFEVWLDCHKITLSRQAAKREEAQRLAIECGMIYEDAKKEVNVGEVTKKNIERAIKEAIRLRRAFGDNILKDAPTTDIDKLMSKISF